LSLKSVITNSNDITSIGKWFIRRSVWDQVSYFVCERSGSCGFQMVAPSLDAFHYTKGKSVLMILNRGEISSQKKRQSRIKRELSPTGGMVGILNRAYCGKQTRRKDCLGGGAKRPRT